MNKREEILEKSLDLFSAYGYENIGIQKIVDSVDVKKPTLYHYFGSKRGLLEELVKIYFLKLNEELSKKATYHNNLINTLEATVKVYFNFAKSNAEFMSFFLTMLSASKESELYQVAKPHIKWVYDFLSDTFVKAIPEHGNIQGKERQLTVTFYGMVNAYISMYLHEEANLDGDTYFRLTKQFMHGIFA